MSHRAGLFALCDRSLYDRKFEWKLHVLIADIMKPRRTIFIVIGIIVALAITWKLLPLSDYFRTVSDSIESCGYWGIAAYFLLYSCLVLVAFPNTPLNIGAGLLFSVSVGFGVAMAAGLLGSCLCFLFSRYLARDWVSQRVEGWNGRWLLDAVEEGGFKVMLLARLNPLLPGSVKNFGFGATDVPLWKYAAATFLGQAPIYFMYVYLGWTGVVSLGKQDGLGVWHYVLLGGGFVMSAALAALLANYSRKRLATT